MGQDLPVERRLGSARTTLTDFVRLIRKKLVSSKEPLPESQNEPKRFPSPVKHTPEPKLLGSTNATCLVKHCDMPTYGGSESFHALLHVPSELNYPSVPYSLSETGAVLVAGIFGGYDGPSSIYKEVVDALASLPKPIPVLRLDFRRAGHIESCVEDIWSAMTHLERMYLVSKFVLVGWSFGGAPVFNLSAQETRKYSFSG